MYREENQTSFVKKTVIGVLIGAGVVGLILTLFFGLPAWNRYQDRANAENRVIVNEITIKSTAQLVEVENQKAAIKVAEANGIAQAQHIINATLTDRYLQHEAINAQEKMANSPNHTTIYIPSGQNGIPLVRTANDEPERK